MIPMEPGPEDFARQLADRRAQMESARVIAYMAHSRRGVLARFLQRLVDRMDPTGNARRDLR
jgi:hypothetical protein